MSKRRQKQRKKNREEKMKARAARLLSTLQTRAAAMGKTTAAPPGTRFEAPAADISVMNFDPNTPIMHTAPEKFSSIIFQPLTSAQIEAFSEAQPALGPIALAEDEAIPDPPPAPEEQPAEPDPWIDPENYEATRRAAIALCEALGHDPMMILNDRAHGMAPRFFWTSYVVAAAAVADAYDLHAPTGRQVDAGAWTVEFQGEKYRITPDSIGIKATVSLACERDTETYFGGDLLFWVPIDASPREIETGLAAYLDGKSDGEEMTKRHVAQLWGNFQAFINHP